jgi:hypothetical protein
MELDLENIEQNTIPFMEYNRNWIFSDENDKLASVEHQEQIRILDKEASNFLWDFEMSLGLSCSSKYFKEITKFDTAFKTEKEIKKHLYNLGIPFSQFVFLSMQPDCGFQLTWKMIIKYSHNIFNGIDQVISDKTFNWRLVYHHDGEFTYGRGYIYDGQNETLKREAIINKTLKEIEKRNSR